MSAVPTKSYLRVVFRSFFVSIESVYELLEPRCKLYRIVADDLSPIKDKYSIGFGLFATINYFAELPRAGSQW